MSLYTWKKEFYPVEATAVPIKDALAHSLKKWEGLRPENLAKHGLVHDSYDICEQNEMDTRLHIDAYSCALCEHYLKIKRNGKDESDNDECATCPLAIARGGVRCDNPARYEMPEVNTSAKVSNEDDALLRSENFSPYREFTSRGDPEPMIYWLKRASEL